MKSITELEDWDGQSLPTPRHQLGKPIKDLDAIVDKQLPNFGPYAKVHKRGERKQREQKKSGTIEEKEDGQTEEVDDEQTDRQTDRLTDSQSDRGN